MHVTAINELKVRCKHITCVLKKVIRYVKPVTILEGIVSYNL